MNGVYLNKCQTMTKKKMAPKHIDIKFYQTFKIGRLIYAHMYPPSCVITHKTCTHIN